MKETIIKRLTDLMATVQMAHYKGRDLGVRAHENPQADSAAISIDLYHFEGDGKPVCEGLKPCKVTCYDGNTIDEAEVFAMHYDPDDERHPLTLIVAVDEGADTFDVTPDQLPDKTLTAITQWLEKAMKPNNHIAEENEMVKEKNDVTSFFFYMWNKWNEDECKLVWKDDFYPHFWTKWCYLCDRYGRFGAVEEFFAELSNNNRDKLVKRALELYNGMSEK